MSRQNATNFSGGLQFPYATAAADLFKKEDVQTLALAVDGHDHSPGKGVGVFLTPGIISTAQLADNAVTSAKIVNGTIVAADLDPAIPNSAFAAQGAWVGSAGMAVAVPATTWTPCPVAPQGFAQVVGAIGSIAGGIITLTQPGLYLVLIQVFFTTPGNNVGAVYVAVGANGAPSTMAQQSLAGPGTNGTQTQNFGTTMYPLQIGGNTTVMPMVYSAVAGTCSSASVIAMLMGHL